MPEAEEHHVHLLPGHIAGEAQGSVAHQSFMHVAHQVACVGFAVGKYNLG